MKQNHFTADNGEQGSDDSIIKGAPNLPEAWFHLSNQWHSQGPAELNFLDIRSYSPSFWLLHVLQELAYWLIPGDSPEEPNGKN